MAQTDAIATYYDGQVETEWERLALNWLEYGVSLDFIRRELSAPARILDVGGGPGRYALALAGEGHSVDLLDLSAGNIAFAEAKAVELGIGLASARQGDARDLSAYPDASYDRVLVFGPLYHLVEPAEQARVIREAVRVLKPSGRALFAFISRYAAFHFNTKRKPGAIAEWRGLSDRIFAGGLYRPEGEETFFIESAFVDPAWIDPFMADFPLQRITLFGAEGLFAQSEAITGALSAEARRHWLDLAIAYAETKGALYGSEHLVYVGRKLG